MIIREIAAHLESIAPLSLQEDYDNAGLITGDPSAECTGVLCTLDVTEDVVAEAVKKKCNCIVSHHPVIFRGIKKLSAGDQVSRTVIAAIKNDIALYACHTNLDNIADGVSGMMARKLGLRNKMVMTPSNGILRKLFTFVPSSHLETVREALFNAGAGGISGYTECSFTQQGTGTFRPGEGTHPFSGEIGRRENAEEIKLELIFPRHLQSELIRALKAAHPYEEVAYDVIALENPHQGTGAGLLGESGEAITEEAFINRLQAVFGLKLVRHTSFIARKIEKIALCGGAGSFLISKALAMGADAFVTSDLKYHEFFLADGKMLLCDIGHYESEQFTTELLAEILLRKFPTFAVLKSEVPTNPVRYFSGK